jgi:hypothetical protein
MAKKLFVRFTTEADEKDVFDFYAENSHAFVFKREAEVWKERISSGAVTIIQDEAGKIVAASISYPLLDKDTHQWTEIGSTRVALDGLGLFNALIGAQVLRAYFLEPPADRFALEIMEDNKHSKHVFAKIGASVFEIPDALRAQVEATIAPESKGNKVEWFHLGVETIPKLAQIILDFNNNPLLKHKVSGEEYIVDFSKCVLMTHFKEQVEDAAKQNFGDVRNPDLNNGIKDFKNKYHP